MNKFGTRILVLAACFACVALVGAQGAGGAQGQGQGQGRGQGQRGGFGQNRRGGGGGEMGLVTRPDVQKELAITDDQKTKLTELRGKNRPAGGGQRGGGANGGGNGGGANGGGTFDAAAFQKRMEEQRTQQHKDLAAILNETQMKRLGELVIQRGGNNSLMQADVQKALNFTAEQTAKVKDLQQKQQEASTALREKVRNQELTREESQAAQQKNQKTMGEELAKILTADQAAKFKEMQGKAFTFDPDTARGGGGGL
jgi:hypothetical protein